MAKRPPLEERIRARQEERGPIPEGKYFEHGPAKIVFIGLIVIIVLTHIAALIMIELAP